MSIIYLCSSNLYVRKYLCVCVHSTPQIKELFLSWLFQKLTFLFTVSQFNNSLKHIILISLLPWWTFSWNFVAHTTVFKHYNRASITPKLSTNPCRPASYVTCVLNTVNVTGSKPPGSSSFLFLLGLQMNWKLLFRIIIIPDMCQLNHSLSLPSPTPGPQDSTETHLN